MAVYLRECNNFGEALNNILFELRVPEYYDPNLPSYYKEPRKSDPPVINGEIVSWDEYYERYPDRKNSDARQSFIPGTIYKSEEYNMSETRLCISDIIDLCDNKIPFDFVRVEDLEWVVELMDGYVREVNPYVGFNQKLDIFLSRLRNARKVISDINELNRIRIENLKPKDKRKPRSLIEILNSMM